MKTGDVYLNNLLADYRRRLEEQEQELRTLPAGSLAFRKTKGGTEYVRITKRWVDGRTIYLRTGISKKPQLVRQLARKKYLELSVKALAAEIKRLTRFLENRIEPDAAHVLQMLPAAYRALPEEMFFSARTAQDRWVREPYRQNTFRPEEKIHITGTGLRVRSKSELLIAEKLDAYGLPYRYERVIAFENHFFSPDFEIAAAGGIVYWEHCGMMSDSRYRSSSQWKLKQYEKMGIVPWKNLIVTYDMEDGGLNIRIIESEIVNKLLEGRSSYES